MDIVRDGYDQIAKLYLDDRERLKSAKYVKRLLKNLPKGSNILDLGCGAGVPVDEMLLKAGHTVRGIDVSATQIKLATKFCRGASYKRGDIQDLKRGEYRVEAVIALYVLFHIPRVKHLEILKIIASFLPKGGLLLISMGDREFEGRHQMFGVSMWSSQYGTARNRQMIEQARLEILVEEVDVSGGERHQVILAQKID